jgi:uncharacterized OsmC-like protein
MADIAAALKRVTTVLRRSPKTGLHTDAPATARWDGGTRVTSSHASGTRIVTDLPVEMGGEGSSVSPGWLLRAGLASCVTTRIVMAAAVAGIELTRLEIVATSQSDTRGLLEMTDPNGDRVTAGPTDVRLQVTIGAARPASARTLRTLVERCHRASPVSCAIQDSTPVELRIVVAES